MVFGKQCTGWFDGKTRHVQGVSSVESNLIVGSFVCMCRQQKFLNKGLSCSIYEEFIQLTNQKTVQLKNGKRT